MSVFEKFCENIKSNNTMLKVFIGTVKNNKLTMLQGYVTDYDDQSIVIQMPNGKISLVERSQIMSMSPDVT